MARYLQEIPRTNDQRRWTDWFREVKRMLTEANSIPAEVVDNTGIEEIIDDRVSELIQDGNGITWSYNDELGTLTPSIETGSIAWTCPIVFPCDVKITKDTPALHLIDPAGTGILYREPSVLRLTNDVTVGGGYSMVFKSGRFLDVETFRPVDKISGAFAIEAWVNGGVGISNATVLGSKSGVGGTAKYFYLWANNGTWKYALNQSVYTTSKSVTAGWHHVILTWNGTDTTTFYLDTSSGGTGSVAGLSNLPLFNIYIGARNADGTDDNHWGGMIDLVRIYNDSLSTDEITELYAGGAGVTTLSSSLQAKCIGEWQFRDKPGWKDYREPSTILYRTSDISGYNNHATFGDLNAAPPSEDDYPEDWYGVPHAETVQSDDVTTIIESFDSPRAGVVGSNYLGDPDGQTFLRGVELEFLTDGERRLYIDDTNITADIDVRITATDLYVGSDSIKIYDSAAEYTMTLENADAAMSADRTLSVDLNDGDRTVTIQGDPTLDDWFDQSVKTTASPTFASGVAIGTVTIADGSITDSGGAISFGDENLSTSGSVQGGTITDGTASFTGGVLTGASGNISMWTNDVGYYDADSDVDHNQTTNYDANEHVDHTGVTLTAGVGLTGTGDISASRTFDVDVGIGDDKIVQIDDVDAASGQYARFTANGIEGIATADVLADLSGDAAGSFDWNDQDIVNIGNIEISNGAELRFYDAGDSHYVGFEAPALTATQIWVLPAEDGDADDILSTDGAGNLSWVAPGAGAGDVTAAANLTDNSIIRGDGGAKGVQDCSILIDDSDNITGIVRASMAGLTIGTDKIYVADTFTDEGINAAIDALGAEGGLALLPEGGYTCDAVVTIDADNTNLEGTGWGTILNNSTGHVIDVNGKDYCMIRDLKIVGGAGGGVNQWLIDAYTTTGPTYLGLINNYLGSADQYALAARGADYSLIALNTVYDPDSFGLILYNSDYCRMIGNLIDTPGNQALAVDSNSQATVISGNVVTGTGVYGYSVNGPNSVVSGNYARTVQYAIYLGAGCDHSVASSNVIYNSARTGLALLSGSDYNAVNNNAIDTATYDGIYSASKYSTFIGNTIYSSGNTYQDITLTAGNDLAVMGNVMYGVAGRSERGIYHAGTYSVLMGNISRNHDTTEIELAAGANHNIIFGNNTGSVAVVDNSGQVNNIIWDFDTTNMKITGNSALYLTGQGISDNQVCTVDQVGAADNDFAKFTANGIEGRSYAETLADLSGQAGAAFSWNSQNLTSVGTIGCSSLTTTGNATITSYLGVGLAPGANPFIVSHSRDNYLSLLYNTSSSNPEGQIIYFSNAAPDNNSQVFLRCEDNSAIRCIIYSDGDLANHDGTYGAISDKSLKQDIVPARSYWDDWKRLIYSKWRSTEDVKANPDCGDMFGVCAQDLETVFPRLVHENEDGIKWNDYSNLAQIGGKVLQEAQARIEALEAKVAELENK